MHAYCKIQNLAAQYMHSVGQATDGSLGRQNPDLSGAATLVAVRAAPVTYADLRTYVSASE